MANLAPSAWLTVPTLAFASLFALTGASAILSPLPTLGSIMHFTPPSSPTEGRRFASSMTRMYGMRDLCSALLILTIWLRGDRALLGWAMVFATPVALMDAFATRVELKGKNELAASLAPHWISAGVLGAVGGLLAFGGW